MQQENYDICHKGDMVGWLLQLGASQDKEEYKVVYKQLREKSHNFHPLLS